MQYRWRIFLATLDPIRGSEQGKTRPVLVISDEDINQIMPVVTTLPLTSLKPGRTIYLNETLLPAPQTGLDRDSLVLCHQVRTLDKSRLIKQIGAVEHTGIRSAILQALCLQLAIYSTDV